jgi:CheY-like chemotaxis protein
MTPARILIVDDDGPFLDTYRELLAEDGYSVETATTRAEVLAKLDIGTWDVVLLDQKLEGPGGPDGGISLAQEVRARAPGAKVIIVTAYAEPAAIRRAFDAGVFDYVEKTEVLETLLRARLRNALALTQSQRLAALASDAIEQEIEATWRAVLSESDRNRKGALLEKLCADLLRTVPGWIQAQTRRRNEVEEIDIVVRNESADELWRKCGAYILFECKHWSKPVGVVEARSFLDKVKGRFGRCSLGFFVTMGDVTEPFRSRLREERRTPDALVVILTRGDLDALVRATDRSSHLKQLHERAVIELNGHE